VKDTNIVRELLTKYLDEAVSETMDAFFDKVWGTRDAQEEAKFIQERMIDAVRAKWGDIRELLSAAPFPSPWLAAHLPASRYTADPPCEDKPVS
jgi:hypothetical protein